MSLDNQIFDSLQRLERDTGELVAGQRNLEKYISAVSENGRRIGERLDNHVLDPEAHGNKAVSASWHMVLAISALILAIGTFLVQVVK